MANPTARERELERALLDLRICAAPFASGRGMNKVRAHLKRSIESADNLITSTPCQRNKAPSLHDLADAADEELREKPNYRADLDR